MNAEWGIRHHQGVAVMPSEARAREELPYFMRRYEQNFRNNFKPFIVRREVSDWEEES